MALNTSAIQFVKNLNRYIKLPNTVSVRAKDSFTLGIAFTVGADSLAEGQLIYCERQGTGTGIRLAATAYKGKLTFLFSPKDGVAATAYTYATTWDDRWHHAAFTVRMSGDNPTYEIYLDSISVADGTLVVPAEVEAVSDTAPKGVYLGNHSRLASGESFPISTAWDGFVDDLTLHTPSISQSDISTYITDKKHWTLPDEDLVAYFKFDASSGTTAVDSSAFTPTRSGTLYQGNTTSSALWTINRPYLGDGLLDTTAPTAPTSNAHTNVTADGFSTSWGSSTDNVWVQFYELQVSEFADFSSYIAYDTGRVQNRVVSGLLPATNYYWRVRAFDAELNASSYSSVRSLTTLILTDVQPPMPPTNLGVSFLTHTSFRINFTQSVSLDAVGYKIDISTSPEFETYVTSYRNHDIGNVNYIDVGGSIEQLTSYFVRLRAYDAFANESNDSVILQVNTPRRPDITPPEVAVMLDPLSVTAKTATLRWLEGVDDTGVVGYYLDLSTVSNFATYVTANNVLFDSVDVGNVLSYRLTNLEPDTTYYARLRAYDDADNVAGNMEIPLTFTTAPPSIYEGDLLSMPSQPLVGKVYDNDTSSFMAEVGTDYEVSSRYTSYMEFGATSLAGTLTKVICSAYAKNVGVVTINVAAGTLGAMPTFAGTGLTFNITQANQWFEVDITSMVSLNSSYVVRVTKAGTPVVNLDNGINAPVLIIETDPLTAIQPLTPVVTAQDMSIAMNVVPNPSFETDLSGWTAVNGAVLTRVSGGTDGEAALRMTCPNTNSGVTTGLLPVVGNQPTYVTFDLKRISGTGSVNIRIQGYDMLGNTMGTVQTTSVLTFTGAWLRARSLLASYANLGPQIKVEILSASAGLVYEVDNVTVTSHPLNTATSHFGPFNGNTAGAYWTGAANNSVSALEVPYFTLDIPYVGDSNENATAVFAYKLKDKPRWTYRSSLLSRDTINKKWNARIGPYANFNAIANSSFETSTVGWTGGARVNDWSYEGEYSYIFLTSASTSFYRELGVDRTLTAKVRGMPGATTSVTVTGYNLSGVLTQTVTSTSVIGDGTWKDISVVVPLNVNVRSFTITFNTSSVTYLDAVMFGPTLFADLGYLDGSMPEGRWEGRPFESPTMLMVEPDSDYEYMLTLTDPDGFFDTSDVTTFSYQDILHSPPLLDYKTTVQPLEFTSAATTITVTAPYLGDDNSNNSVRFEFKRSDMSTWNEVRPTYDRANKRAMSTITHLNAGSNYTVRAIWSDPDGVFGSQSKMVSGSTYTVFLDDGIDADPLISFGGFLLMGREDGKVGVTSHNAFGFPSRRVKTEVLPRLDGAVERQALWGEKIIKISGYISGDTRADLDSVRTALVRALSPNQQRLIIDTLAQSGRYYYATCEGLSIEEEAETHIRHLDWEASFLCSDPFAYDTAETIVPSFSAVRGSTIALTNSGDSLANPVITITTPSIYPLTLSVINDSTGERIAPKTSIINGDTLVIDVDRRSLTKNGVEVDYSGSFPRLGMGANILRIMLDIVRNVSTEELLDDPAYESLNSTTPLNTSLRWRNRFL